MKTLLAALFLLSPTAALAYDEHDGYRYQQDIPSVRSTSSQMHNIGNQGGYSNEEICYRYLYKEVYIPGTSTNPGTVKSSRDKVEVNCNNRVGGVEQSSNHNHVEPSHQPHYTHLAHAGYSPPPHVVNNYPPQYQQPQPQPYRPSYQQSVAEPTRRAGDGNNCASGTILGAIAGGGGAAALTKGGADMLWTVPLGMIGGSMIGCKVNGG